MHCILISIRWIFSRGSDYLVVDGWMTMRGGWNLAYFWVKCKVFFISGRWKECLLLLLLFFVSNQWVYIIINRSRNWRNEFYQKLSPIWRRKRRNSLKIQNSSEKQQKWSYIFFPTFMNHGVIGESKAITSNGIAIYAFALSPEIRTLLTNGQI